MRINVLDAFNVIVLMEVLLVSGTDQRPSSRWLSNLRQTNNSPQLEHIFEHISYLYRCWFENRNAIEESNRLISPGGRSPVLRSGSHSTCKSPFHVPPGLIMIVHMKFQLLVRPLLITRKSCCLLVLEMGKLLCSVISCLPGIARCCKMEVIVAWSHLV